MPIQPPPATLAKIAKLEAMMIDSKQRRRDKSAGLQHESQNDLDAARVVARAMEDDCEAAVEVEASEEVTTMTDVKEDLEKEWTNIIRRHKSGYQPAYPFG